MASASLIRVILILLGLVLVASLQLEPEPEAGPVTIAWGEDYEEAMERAYVEFQPVMVTFTATWCGYCRRMDKETFSDPAVVDRLARMVNVRVDGDKRPDLARLYGVMGYPATFFLSPDGSRRESVLGFQTARSFLASLDRTMDFRAEEYVLRQRLEDHEDLFDARVRLAEILSLEGNMAAAAEQYGRALSGQPSGHDQDQPEIRLNFARSLLATDRVKEALAELHEVAESEQSPARTKSAALFLAAQSHVRSGSRETARRMLTRLLQIWDKGWMADRAREQLEG
jgi:thioredoxin-like negative regulator of GroEL